jgi:hypothetical protein
MSIMKKLVEATFSAKNANRIRHIAAILRGAEYGFLRAPTYNDDGLITQHVCTFMGDLRFLRAYEVGAATGALRTHPGHIHWRAYVACWAAMRAMRLKGDFCECGVNLGLLSRAIVDYVDFDSDATRTFYLFDTFDGIPEDVLSPEERERGVDNDAFGYTECYEDVARTFSAFPNVKLIRGKVPESFESCEIGAVAYLSIDMNNAFSEIAALEYFWDKLVPGAIVVLDDYAYGEQFAVQRHAFDTFSGERDVSVLTLPTGQGLIIKP